MWKTIQDYDNYEMNIEGQVRNKTTEKVLKGYKDNRGYLMINLYNNSIPKLTKLHRLIAQMLIPNPDNLPQVDHINGKRDDNRIENLRWVTNQQNSWNRNNKGYSQIKNGRFQAKIKINGKTTHIGCYDTPEEARQAYLNKAQELRAGFIRQN